MPDQLAYTSNKPFDPDHHLDGLFLVCSDGRFEAHVNDFREHLRQSLGLRKLDRYFVPGSQLQFVAGAAGHPSTDQATEYWAKFFIDNHVLHHVVIVGHELCAAYGAAPAYKNLSPAQLRQQQEAHLRQRRDLIQKDYPNVQIHLYYMKPRDGNSGVDFFSVT